MLEAARLRVLPKGLTAPLRAYYAGPNHPAKLRLWRWFRALSGYPRLTIGYAAGGIITVDERDYMENQMLVHGDYEPEVWQSLALSAAGNEVVWDVGANIGDVTVKAMRHAAVREVHAFEPHPVVARILRRHVSMNSGRATTHEVALGDSDGTGTLHNAVFPLTGGHTLRIDPRNSTFDGTFQVACRTADTMIFREGVPAPTLLKVDVEQFEYPFFQGAERLLREAPPKAIVFEAAHNERTNDLEDPAILRLLEGAGYRVDWIRRRDGNRWLRENFLALRA